MTKKCFKFILKLAAFLIAFAVIFAGIQEVFKKVNSNDDKGHLEVLQSFGDEIDVLFLGSSQMFCTVNAQKLTEEYKISSCDFGASAQTLPITYYYLQEASKYCEPKLVAVEVTKFFQNGIPNESMDQTCAWNYNNMPLTFEKYQSINDLVNGDRSKLLTYCFFPILENHTLWNQISPLNLIINLTYEYDFSLRGFLPREKVTPVNIAYLQNDNGPACIGAEDEISALHDIVNFCEKKGIKVLFFKSPTNTWTISNAIAVKSFMQENQYDYLEMNDYYEDMDIDAATDFFNDSHLNTSGANKATDFLAKYLQEKYRNLLK